MQRLRKIQQTIQASALALTVSQRLLIGTVLVLMVMTLLLVQLYAGKPEMVALLPGKTVDEQVKAIAYLQSNGIEYIETPSGVMVPAGQRHAVLAQLSQGGALAGDNKILFDNLIDRQTWTMSQQQNRQLEIIAVQNTLESIIGQMSGIGSARVILNLPSRRSLGQPKTSSSASVTVFANRSLGQDTVDAIVHLVGSSRGIDPTNIRVIDGLTNRQHKGRDDDTLIATSYLELVTSIEVHQRQKLMDMLEYIPGVIVTVHAQVDATRQQTTRNEFLPEGAGTTTLLKQEVTSEMRDRQASTGGEPGPRSNVGQNITGSGGAGGGASSEQTTSESSFESKIGSETKQIMDPRGHAKKINAVVNIPRTYFVGIWKSGQQDPDAAEPATTDIQPIIDSEIARIKGEVEQMIDSSAQDDSNAEPGEVKVSMIPVLSGMVIPQGVIEGAGVMAIGGGGAFESIPVVKTIALGSLAAVALGLVVFTALRSVKAEVLPSAAELVGLPPALDNTSDLVGEADEVDSVLQGIELTEDEIRVRKVTEQVNDLVDDKPDDAARLIGRWITGD